jgi:hypothetical protein
MRDGNKKILVKEQFDINNICLFERFFQDSYFQLTLYPFIDNMNYFFGLRNNQIVMVDTQLKWNMSSEKVYKTFEEAKNDAFRKLRFQ